MASIRARLTTAYAAALIGTMVAFALALWVARRATVYRELERYVTAQADLALRIVRQAEESGEPVTVLVDPEIGQVVTPRLKTLLEGVPDYLIVLDENGRTLY